MKKVLRLIFTILLSIASLGSDAASLKLRFFHQYGKKNFNDSTTLLSPQGDSIRISNFKYYLGNFVAHYQDGRIEKLKNKKGNYILIDVENSKRPLGNYVIFKGVPEGDITHITFGIGVDSLTNDRGLGAGALDPMKGMYWSWNSGFINFKLEGTCFTCSAFGEFGYHLGGFLPPHQSYQTVNYRHRSRIKDGKNKEDIYVDFYEFLKHINVRENPRIMSPSSTSSELSKQLPLIFRNHP